MQANIARQNNFQLLSDDEWFWIIDEIKRHTKYRMLTIPVLDRIIRKGVRHEYNDHQFSINAATIFKWLARAWDDMSETEKDELRRNFNENPAYYSNNRANR